MFWAAVEKLTSEQQIRLAYWRRPETGEKLCVYDPDDVERIRKERNLGEDERSGADRGDARFDPTGELGQASRRLSPRRCNAGRPACEPRSGWI
jgi:hypothetical protein